MGAGKYWRQSTGGFFSATFVSSAGFSGSGSGSMGSGSGSGGFFRFGRRRGDDRFGGRDDFDEGGFVEDDLRDAFVDFDGAGDRDRFSLVGVGWKRFAEFVEVGAEGHGHEVALGEVEELVAARRDARGLYEPSHAHGLSFESVEFLGFRGGDRGDGFEFGRAGGFLVLLGKSGRCQRQKGEASNMATAQRGHESLS